MNAPICLLLIGTLKRRLSGVSRVLPGRGNKNGIRRIPGGNSASNTPVLSELINVDPHAGDTSAKAIPDRHRRGYRL